MPRHRPPKEVWDDLRHKAWQRDGGRCQGPYCQESPPLPLDQCHVDHIRSGKLGGNELSNLRVLCRRCHVLRADKRHRGMVAAALRDGIIPPDWRQYAWDDGDWPSEETVQALKRWAAAQGR